MKSRLSILLTVLLAAQSFAADVKIGLVDLRRAFAEYWRSKDASSKLQENLGKAREEINERLAAYKKLMDDVQKRDKERQDPVLNNDARAKIEADLRNKAQELRSLEQDINEFKGKRQSQLDEEQRQQAKGIYDEIIKVVNDKAAAAGYDLVLDKSNLGMGAVPFLVYSKAGSVPDFTPEVIVELNKNAPAGTPAEEKPAEKPSEKKTDAPSKSSSKKSGKK
jgi:outer membrane protein